MREGDSEKYRHYNPIHSDFLVHWTGKDIEQKHNLSWTSQSSSTTDEEVTQLYLERLKGILKFGLWMTVDKDSRFLISKNGTIERPCPARTCFTELKLSAVRSHAADYGRLGIGFKRFFLFDRMGGPMTYYHQHRENWFFPRYLGKKDNFGPDDFFACFLKPMIGESSDDDITMVYKNYDESEWQIIYSQEIEERLRGLNKTKIINKFRKPNDIEDSSFMEYVRESGDVTPEFLIPVNDKWLALIIYPSLTVKVEAEADREIQDWLEKHKRKKPSNIKLGYKPGPWERYSKPIQINLDACRNF